VPGIRIVNCEIMLLLTPSLHQDGYRSKTHSYEKPRKREEREELTSTEEERIRGSGEKRRLQSHKRIAHSTRSTKRFTVGNGSWQFREDENPR